jgi:Calcium binding
MSPARQADPELDNLIWEITADCNDEDEVLMGFEGAIDEQASFPCPSTLIGEQVEVLSITVADDRPELIATCTRNGRTYKVALLDINIEADPHTSRVIAAYRRWAACR